MTNQNTNTKQFSETLLGKLSCRILDFFYDFSIRRIFGLFLPTLSKIYNISPKRIVGKVDTARRRIKAKKLNTINTPRMQKFQGIHEGQTAFILGNGPSVRVEDLEKLSDKVTFAANRFYRAYSNMKFRPTYTGCTDLLVLKASGDEIAKECKTPFFIAERACNSLDVFEKNENVSYFQETEVPLSSDPSDFIFSNDATDALGFGYSIIYSMMQMAVYMGAKEIVLYGIDHSFKLPKDFTRPGKMVTHKGEDNHFIKNYRNPNEKWAPPNPRRIEAAFQAARDFCETNGIKVWNCTHGGKLEIFDRKSIYEFIPG